MSDWSALKSDERTVTASDTRTYRATLKDDADPIPLASIGALTLTLRDLGSNEIVNGRNAQNVLNQNNVTVHATSGLLTWDIQSADTALLGTGRETHRATFVVTTTGGRRQTLYLDLICVPSAG